MNKSNLIATYNHLRFEEINGFVVSTVKLPPFNEFETMVFGFYPNSNEINYDDLYVERYTNKEDAIEGHKKIVEMAKHNVFLKRKHNI